MMKQRCKTLSARVLAVVLSLVMLLGSLPVREAESRLLSFQVDNKTIDPVVIDINNIRN